MPISFCYRLCLILLFQAATFSYVSGTTYYLKPSGNDALAGTSAATAWKTITKLNASAIAPGDSILFEGGQTFNGNLSFQSPRCGTPSNPVYIGSYGTGKATLNAGTAGHGIILYDCAGFEIANLIITGSGISTNNYHGVLFYTNVPGSGYHGYVNLHDLEVSGFNKGGISVFGDENFTDKGYRDITIERCNAFSNGDHGIQVLAQFFYLTTGHSIHNVYIAYCNAYNNPGEIGKTSGHTGSGIVVGTADTVLIEHCIAHHNGVGNLSTAGGPVGIWAWDCNRATIQFCESYANATTSGLDGGGFDLDGGCTHSVMQYNYSHDNMGAGYLVAQFPGARAMHHITIRYNISERDALNPNYGSIYIYHGGSTLVDSIFVYNNTCLLGTNRGTNSSVVRISRSSQNIGATLFSNNIFITESTAPMVRMSHASSVQKFINNLYFSQSGSFSFIQPGFSPSTTTSLANWRSITGQEKLGAVNKGFQTNPLLTSPGNGGTIGNTLQLNSLTAYLPTSSSPVINQGMAVQSLVPSVNMGVRDFYGNTIPNNSAYDLGAGEHVQAVLAVEQATLSLIEQTRDSLLMEVTLKGVPENEILELEYATEGMVFEKAGLRIHTLPNELSYSFATRLVFRGTTQFRLSWTDIAGTKHFSNAIEVVPVSGSSGFLYLFPNPAFSHLRVKITQPFFPDSTPNLIDLTGRKVAGITWNLLAGGGVWETQVHHLPAGVYYVEVPGGLTRLCEPFVKL